MTDDPRSAGPEPARGNSAAGAGRAVGRATPPGGVAIPDDGVEPLTGAATPGAGASADEEQVVSRDQQTSTTEGGAEAAAHPSGAGAASAAPRDVLAEALAQAKVKVAEATRAGDAARARAAEAAKIAEEAAEAEAAQATGAARAADPAGCAARAADPAGGGETDGPAEPEAAAGTAAEAAEPAVAAEAPSVTEAQVLGVTGLFAELEALRAALDERTADLQRVVAEYANYRKRVDRDRALVVEQATGNVLAVLLPVLDDLDRAREHGDLVGPFGAVAEQLTNALTRFGLSPFGAKGDPFDPTQHEAVSHSLSAEVTEPTCVDIMRRGYVLGERLLRPALVAVAEAAS